MKTIFSCILYFTLVQSSYTQHWEILNGGMPYFRTIDFVNDNIGWMAGDGILFKTENGGITWYKIYLEENLDLSHFDFYNEDIGWMLISDNNSAYIRKTIDGGQTWEIKKTFDFFPGNSTWTKTRPIHAINESTVVFIAGFYIDSTESSEKAIYRTDDGGSTWLDISPDLTNKSPEFIWFINSKVGLLACGNSVLRTLDSGITWQEYPLPDFYGWRDFQVINDYTAIFFADNGGSGSHFLCTTTDTGRTFSSIPQNDISSIYFADENTAFAISRDTVSYFIMKSTDGGFTWEEIYNLGFIGTTGPFGGRDVESELYFSNTKYGYAIFDKGGAHLLRSIDGGNNWKFQNFSYPLYDVHFFDGDHGLACGGYMVNPHGPIMTGDVFKTDDGGQTWDLNLSAGAEFRSLYFVNDYTGFALAEEGGLIYKTINRGDEWYLVHYSSFEPPDTSYILFDMYFTNEQTGWACGRYWAYETDSYSSGLAILGTNDGGENWNPIWTYQLGPDDYYIGLYSIYFAGNKGWAVEGGGSGSIVKYTEQDQWQIDTSVTDLPLNKVYFSDENHGWITGGYFYDNDMQLILLKTIDGGETWIEKRDLIYQFNDMYIVDSLHGWAAGTDTSYHGTILKTVDGGDTWVPQIENLSAPLYALHFREGCGWAVGSDGLVLRTEDGTTWVDQRTGQNYPVEYKLSQNYPNPFNPSTTIEFMLPKSEFVELKVYNILGKGVATLVSKNLNQGSHICTFDGKNLASGIYYYQLQASDFIEVKKMLLIK